MKSYTINNITVIYHPALDEGRIIRSGNTWFVAKNMYNKLKYVEECSRILGDKVKSPKLRYVKSNVLPVFRAIMIPHIGIFIKEDYQDDRILHEHELIHWLQYKRMGSFMFLVRYLFQFIFIGYDTMPLELEARQTDNSLWNYRKRNWK